MTNILVHRITGNFLETQFEFGRNGNFTIFSQGNIDQDLGYMLDLMDDFLQKYFSEYWRQEATEGQFYRFTNDKSEFDKIASGNYTNSINHQDGRQEKGISVSCNMSYAALGQYKYFYIVSGKIISSGSDGEPLLDASTMQKRSPYKSVACFLKKAEKNSEKAKQLFCKEYDWSTEQLEDLLYETLRHRCEISYISEDNTICKYSRWGVNKQKIENYANN